MKVIALALTTFREEVRRRIFLFLLLFAGVMIASSWIFSFFSSSEELRIVKNMGLTSISLVLTVIGIVMGIRMIPGEIDKRTISTILCKPVSRTQYLLGKFLGGALTLATITLVMGAVYMIVVAFKSRELQEAVDFRLIEQILLAFLQGSLLLAMSLMFSTFLTQIMNGALSLFVLIAGNLSDTLQDIIRMSKNHVVEVGLRVLYYLVPNWQNFSVQDTLVRGEDPVALTYVAKIAIYGILYIAVILVVAVQAFRYKEV